MQLLNCVCAYRFCLTDIGYVQDWNRNFWKHNISTPHSKKLFVLWTWNPAMGWCCMLEFMYSLFLCASGLKIYILSYQHLAKINTPSRFWCGTESHNSVCSSVMSLFQLLKCRWVGGFQISACSWGLGPTGVICQSVPSLPPHLFQKRDSTVNCFREI